VPRVERRQQHVEQSTVAEHGGGDHDHAVGRHAGDERIRDRRPARREDLAEVLAVGDGRQGRAIRRQRVEQLRARAVHERDALPRGAVGAESRRLLVKLVEIAAVERA
jgi:hypothetical protein